MFFDKIKKFNTLNLTFCQKYVYRLYNREILKYKEQLFAKLQPVQLAISFHQLLCR